MANVTRGELKNRALIISDYENSGFASDSELNVWANDGYKEFYDLILAQNEDHFVLGPVARDLPKGETTIALSSLPSFYRLKGLDIKLDDDRFSPVPTFSFGDRNKKASADKTSYRIVGANIVLAPALEEDTTFNVWYIPEAPPLNDDNDFFADFNGWGEYVALYIARRIKIKAEEDTSPYDADMSKLVGRIKTLAVRRDDSEVTTIQDVEAWDDEKSVF